MEKTYKVARKVVIAVVGLTVLVIGLAMIVLPGPGLLIIIGGLAILAIEFAWAERYLNKAKYHFNSIKEKAKNLKK